MSTPTLALVGKSPSSWSPPDRTRTALICFSHLRWNFVYQRPQHLLTRASSEHDVYFIEEPIVRDDAQAHIEWQIGVCGVRVGVPVLPHGLSHSDSLQAQRDLLSRLVSGLAGRRRVLWYYTPMALEFTRHLGADLSVYDNMDELSAFKGASPELLALEDELFRRVDLVFTGGQSLYEAKKGRHASVHVFASSIDKSHFAQARNRLAEPADQRMLGRPRLGFFGVIDERMDLELVEQIALARPDWHIVMIGPVVKIDESSLPRPANLHWVGARSYAELPSYLAHWDVGFMPFAINESTRYISPTKTPEFLAAGVPVVSTPIRDVVRPYGERGLVDIASTAAEFVVSVERWLTQPRDRWLHDVDRLLAPMSWDRTWEGMQRLIDAPRSKSTPAVARGIAHPSLAAAAASAGLTLTPTETGIGA